MEKYKKYVVVVRPFYREQEPYLLEVSAKTEKEAHEIAIKNRNVKETMEAKLADKMEWNEQEIEKYWRLYR